MNDNQVIRQVIAVLNTGLPALGVNGVLVTRSYQPRQNGVPTGPALFLSKISAPRYGFPGRRDVYNAQRGDFDHTESTWRTPTWQVDGLSTQDPRNLDQLTASDIVEAAADVLQQSSTRNALLQQKIGIQRITNIRENYFIDDRERHEQRPSFDFTLTYRREFTTTVPPVTSFTCKVRRTC